MGSVQVKNILYDETLNNRNYVLLYMGGDENFRMIHLLPRSFSLYNNIHTTTMNFELDVEHVMTSAKVGDIILIYGTYNDIDLLSKIQDGAQLTPLQVVQIIETAIKQGYIATNVTKFTNDRDHEILSTISEIDEGDSPSYSYHKNKDDDWNAISLVSIEKMKKNGGGE